MANADRIELEGEVIDVTKGNFVVELENGHRCNCTLSGRMRVNSIRIVKGDKVTIDVSPYDLTRGRITYRNK